MIRWATAGDATELADVHVTTWQSAYEGIFSEDFLGGMDRGRRAAWWHRFIDGGAKVHVADVDGRVVGFCHASDSEDEAWGEIFSIYVLPEHWGDGHGRALLAAGERTLMESGHERALLWVLEGNERGRRFYERQGWVQGKPVRIEEIGGTQVTELRYEKGLREDPVPGRDPRGR